MLSPFIPETAEEIIAELGGVPTGYDSIGSAEKFGLIEAGKSVCDSRVLFARVDEAKKMAEFEAEMKAQMEEAKAAQSPEKPEPMAEVGIEDFMSLELRSAKVISCEKVPKAKKLLCLQLDLGYEKRQVVSGIALHYTPEQLVGKKVIVVANLHPAKLCGIESQGLILASGEEKVRVVFLDDETPLGERIR